MARRKSLHPTELERAAMLAVAALAVGWLDAGDGTGPLLRTMLDQARAYLRSAVRKSDVDAACAAIVVALGTPTTPLGTTPRALLRAAARDAVFGAVGAATVVPVEASVYAAWERTLFGHVEAAGEAAGVRDAPDVARRAWGDALAEASERKVVPNSPDHARLILRGMLVKRLRAQRKLTVEELAAKARDLGGVLTARQVTLVEHGTGTFAAARDASLVEALGVSTAWLDDRLSAAEAFASRLAGEACGVEGARWFGDAAAQDDDDVARAFALVAVVAVLRKL